MRVYVVRLCNAIFKIYGAFSLHACVSYLAKKNTLPYNVRNGVVRDEVARHGFGIVMRCNNVMR